MENNNNNTPTYVAPVTKLIIIEPTQVCANSPANETQAFESNQGVW